LPGRDLSDYNSQPKDFRLALLCSAATLQPWASVALPCGVEAACRHESRHIFKEELNCARAASGTLPVMHASYFVRKSSHSGTPMAVPEPVAVVAGVLVVAVVPVVAGVMVVAGVVVVVAGVLLVVVVVVV
jgi:hypothetical protein